MAATRFHNKVERVFLVMHIGFVGVYSGNVTRVFFCTNEGFFGTFGGFFGTFWGGFLLSAGGVFLVQNARFFGTSQGGFFVGTMHKSFPFQCIFSPQITCP